MSNLFNSIFNDTIATANPIQLFLALLVSLILGLALTWAYKHRTLYTREFAISLTLLPCLMTLVIFLVNGSLGTSIGVARLPERKRMRLKVPATAIEVPRLPFTRKMTKVIKQGSRVKLTANSRV